MLFGVFSLGVVVDEDVNGEWVWLRKGCCCCDSLLLHFVPSLIGFKLAVKLSDYSGKDNIEIRMILCNGIVM